MLITAVSEPALPALPAVPPLSSRVAGLPSELVPLMRRYVPLTVALKLQDGFSRELDLSEMRQASF
eukprot:492165-Prymnesium_polylepis.1